MLIPIGQEESTVRRHPWVSYGLILANVALFVVTAVSGPGSQWTARVTAKLGEITTFLERHPYLELPDLAEFCDAKCQREAAARRAAAQRNQTLPPSWRVADEQRWLDDLAAELRGLRDELPARRLGYVPKEHRPERALTSMFVHAGWLHLLGNMLFLFITGPFVEDALGRVLFPVLYFLSGFAASGLHAAKFPDSTVPLVGASGAIAGLMGAFLVRYTFRNIRMMFLPLFPLPRPQFTFSLPAFVLLPLWFGGQFWFAQRAGTESGVAFWAHVGGFAFGAAAMLAIRVAGIETRWIRPAIDKELVLEQHAGLERALDARMLGRMADARREIAAVLAAEPSNVDAWLESYTIAKAERDGKEMGRSASRLVDLYARADERDLLVGVVREACDDAVGPLPPRLFLTAGTYLEKKGEFGVALETYDRLVSAQPADAAVVRALLRRAEILRGLGDRGAAREALARARAHPSCVEGLVVTVERAQAGLG